MKKRISVIASVLVLAISLLAFSGCGGGPFATAVSERIDEVSYESVMNPGTEVKLEGIAVIKTTLHELNERGINVGSEIRVTIGDFSEKLPVVENIIEEDGRIQLWCNHDDDTVNVCVYNGNFMDTYEVSVGDIVTLGKR